MIRNYPRIWAGCIVLSSIVFGSAVNSQVVMKKDSVSMSPSYANEVYYSFKNGMVSTFARNTWDIAFRTKIRSSSIITNDGTGVVLWSYPKSDTSGWSSVDTSGLYSWTRMFNDVNDWENGAFCRNAQGHPDYGWGRYNDQTHDVVGDSIFIIQLRDGSFRKLEIRRKNSVNNLYYFRVAGLDGSAQSDLEVNCNNYSTKEFVGFSLETNLPVDYQPVKAEWDIVFTKYMSIQPNGTPYPVSGVLSNDGVKTMNFHPVPLTYNDFGRGSWDSLRSSIGWQWKYIDTNYVYHIEDSSVYFVRSLAGDIYKLFFTRFAGSSTGLIVFETGLIQGQGIPETRASFPVSVYPNPAGEQIHISATLPGATSAALEFYDLSGRVLERKTIDTLPAENTLDVSGLAPGTYFIRILTSAGVESRKLVISR